MGHLFGLPTELLDQILSLLTNPSDHLHLALTCRLALFFTLPHLYGVVNWQISGIDTKEFEPCRLAIDFLREKPELWECVRTLRLSENKIAEVGRVPGNAGDALKSGINALGLGAAAARNNVVDGPLVRRPQRYADPYFASVHAASKFAWTTVSNFTQLSTLALQSISLPTNFYHIIHAISPSLRNVSLRAVRLTSRYPTSLGDPYDYLRIEDLSLLHIAQGPYTSVAKIKSILRLARSHTLRKLRVDRSVEYGVDSYLAAGVPNSLYTLICDFRGPLIGTGPNSNQTRPTQPINAAAFNAALNNPAIANAPGFAQFAQGQLLLMAQAHLARRHRLRKPLISLFRLLYACTTVKELRMTEVGVVNEDANANHGNVAANPPAATVGLGGGMGLGMNWGLANGLVAQMNAVGPVPAVDLQNGWHLGNELTPPPHHAQGLGAALLANGELNPIINNHSVPIRLFKTAFPNLTDLIAPLSHVRILVHGHASVERPLRSITVSGNVDLDSYGCASSRSPVFGSGASGNKGGVTFVRLEDIASTLRAVRGAMVPLESVAFSLRDWDREVVYMLSEIAMGLKEIKLTYASGGPDDSFFMTLGNIIEFPNLESFHLFRIGHVAYKNYQYTDTSTKKRMQAEDERLMEDHREYLIIWERYMPRLKEVRLVEDVVWVKREEERKEARAAGMEVNGDGELAARVGVGRRRRKRVSRWEKVVLTENY